jgi:uncharacterized membrane protein
MNPVVIVHLIASFMAIAAAIPLIGGRVKMNPWYGVRLPEAFASNDRWLEINRFGGRLLLAWGIIIGLTATVGSFLSRRDWVAYDWTALVVVLGGLALLIALIHRHVRQTS